MIICKGDRPVALTRSGWIRTILKRCENEISGFPGFFSNDSKLLGRSVIFHITFLSSSQFLLNILLDFDL
jgi:hypothetical protein